MCIDIIIYNLRPSVGVLCLCLCNSALHVCSSSFFLFSPPGFTLRPKIEENFDFWYQPKPCNNIYGSYRQSPGWVNHADQLMGWAARLGTVTISQDFSWFHLFVLKRPIAHKDIQSQEIPFSSDRKDCRFDIKIVSFDRKKISFILKIVWKVGFCS